MQAPRRWPQAVPCRSRSAALVNDLPEEPFQDREEFEKLLSLAAKHAGVKLTAPARKAILAALGERDENAEICTTSDGTPEPDPELRDTESVPLPPGPDPIDDQGIPASVQAFFEREVLPHVPDAWINTGKRDERDGLVGLVGYEINFNRYFYRYTPPRPLEEIEADIRDDRAGDHGDAGGGDGSWQGLTQDAGTLPHDADNSR